MKLTISRDCYQERALCSGSSAATRVDSSSLLPAPAALAMSSQQPYSMQNKLMFDNGCESSLLGNSIYYNVWTAGQTTAPGRIQDAFQATAC